MWLHRPHPVTFSLWVRLLSFAVLFVFFEADSSVAQIEWNVSVKLIYDSSGNPPGSNPECAYASATSLIANLSSRFEYANVVLDRMGRGYRFDVAFLHLNPPPDPPKGLECNEAPVTEWTNAMDLLCLRAELEAAALENKTEYLWNDNALNLYVINSCIGGRSATRPVGEPAPLAVMGLAEKGATLRPFHEMGHSLGLCHTHGDCPSAVCNPGAEDDCIDDTLTDDSGWDTANEIAQENFPGFDYLDLTCDEQQEVLDVLYNIMAYHQDNDAAFPLDVVCDPDIEIPCDVEPDPEGCRHRLTQDQLDRITDRSNGFLGAGIVSGRTHFVDANGDPESADGSSGSPYSTVQAALNAAAEAPQVKHIVNLRGGTYSENGLTISQPVTIRSSRGWAMIDP